MISFQSCSSSLSTGNSRVATLKTATRCVTISHQNFSNEHPENKKNVTERREFKLDSLLIFFKIPAEIKKLSLEMRYFGTGIVLLTDFLVFLSRITEI